MENTPQNAYSVISLASMHDEQSTFASIFAKNPQRRSRDPISEMSEILPKNLNPYAQTVTTGAKKV